jgi:hypothetical protein
MNPAFEMAVLDWTPRPPACACNDNSTITIALSRHNGSPATGLLAHAQPVMGRDIHYAMFLTGYDGLRRSSTGEPNGS